MVWLVRGTYVMSRVHAGVSGEVAERERGGGGEEEERKRRGRGEEEERKRRGRGGEAGEGEEKERKGRGRVSSKLLSRVQTHCASQCSVSVSRNGLSTFLGDPALNDGEDNDGVLGVPTDFGLAPAAPNGDAVPRLP